MSAAPPSVPPGLDLNSTIGALLIGIYVSVALFGITTMQAYSYYLNYCNDPWKMKSLVILIWLMEALHVICITQAYYETSVSNFGQFSKLDTVPITFKLSILWSAFIVFVVQVFFAFRIRVMSQRWELASVCWILSSLRVVMALISVAEFVEAPTVADYETKWKWNILTLFSSGALADILIAAGLTYFLNKTRSGLEDTDRIINRIIVFSIKTGLLTSMLVTLMLIIYLVKPDTSIWLAIYVVVARTYSNTLYATLNARNRLRSVLSGSTGLQVARSASADIASQGGQSHSRNLSVNARAARVKPIAIEMSSTSYTVAEILHDDVDTKPHSINDM